MQHVQYEQRPVEMYDDSGNWEYQSEWATPAESWPSEQSWTTRQQWCASGATWESPSSRWPEPMMMQSAVPVAQQAARGPGACQPQGTACATACGAPGACATGNACQGACPAPYLSVEPKAGDEGTELRLAELKRLIDRDAQALRSTREVQEPMEPQSGAVSREGHEAGPTLQRDAAKSNVAPPNSSAKPGDVKNHRVLVDFTPESRDYGEMPLKAGEEVTVRYPIEEDWIFGWKGWPVRDQGWLPAQNLGLGVHLDSEDEVVHEPGAEIKPKEEVEAWHHHGNWWSRQRHLKVDQASAKKDIGDVRRRPQTDPAELQQSRIVSNALAAATNKQASNAPKGNGKGKAGGRGPGSKRVHRERPALENTLDRLRKPLVPPQRVQISGPATELHQSSSGVWLSMF